MLKITRNRDFQKSRFLAAKIGFRSISPVLARHTHPSPPCVFSYYSSTDQSNLYPTNLALHTNQTTLGSLHVPPMMSWLRNVFKAFIVRDSLRWAT